MNIDFTLSLQDDLVLLRPLEKEDFQEFKGLTRDRSMWTWFTHDLSDETVLLEWVSSSISEMTNKTRLTFTVVEKSSGKIAGCTSFGNISYRDKRLEIGWTWLGTDFQGRGINQSMKFLMLEYSFENMLFERVESKTDVLNVPARKALARSGMSEEGILRSHTLMTHNRRRDTIYYSMLKKEWPEVKTRYLKK